ncbi:MAG: hypothetical protein WAN49_10140, partial [Pseudolabrys sp.]
RRSRKVTVVKKGKLRTIIQKLTQLVRKDFTCKDSKAAEKADMPLILLSQKVAAFADEESSIWQT